MKEEKIVVEWNYQGRYVQPWGCYAQEFNSVNSAKEFIESEKHVGAKRCIFRIVKVTTTRDILCGVEE